MFTPIKDKNHYIIKKTKDMNTDVILYLSENLMKGVEQDAVQQIINVASLPGIKDRAYAMPDMHSGYGFPIGGVAGFDLEKGIVSPGGLGFDINCGIRLVKTNSTKEEFEKLFSKKEFEKLFRSIPTGVGSENKERITKEELLDMLSKGIDYSIKNGEATKKDKDCIEDYGKLKTSAEFLSQKAISRGLKQSGTLGSGNHFIELQYIDKIYNKELAKKWGLKENQITFMIHSGSRGLGHQIASDYIEIFLKNYQKYNLKLLDKDLVSIPINSQEGEKYLDSMRAAANYAYVNRQVMTFKVREALKELGINTELVYDVAHNIAKEEEYKINGKKEKLLVHRKGATRAFSAGNKVLPEKYINTGQPVIIPGSMGTCSYVLVGDKAEEKSLGSVSHGAGRALSRSAAKKQFDVKDVIKDLNKINVSVLSATNASIVEEAPLAYKDVNEVVKVLELNELAKPVARMKPLYTIKG